MHDNLGVLEFELSDDQLQRLSALNPIKLGFPHDFASDSEVRELIFGDTFERIDFSRR